MFTPLKFLLLGYIAQTGVPTILPPSQNSRDRHLINPQIFSLAALFLVSPFGGETLVFQGPPELCHFWVTSSIHKLEPLCYSDKNNTFLNFSFQPAFLNVVNSVISKSLCSTLPRVANMQSSTKHSTLLDRPFAISFFCNIAAQQLPEMAKPRGALLRIKWRLIRLWPVYLLHFSESLICQYAWLKSRDDKNLLPLNLFKIFLQLSWGQEAADFLKILLFRALRSRISLTGNLFSSSCSFIIAFFPVVSSGW